MAKIVLGVGCAHTPQLYTAAEDWEIRADRDRSDAIPLWYRGRTLRYAELAALRANERIGDRLDLATRRAALTASFRAIDRLHDAFVAAAPDVVVMVGNDQDEIFSEIVPAFAVLAADRFENMPRTREQIARLPVGIEIADHGHLPEEPVSFAGDRPFGLHLGRGLTARGFDVTLCHRKPTIVGERSLLDGLPHAYGFLYRNVVRDRSVPAVLVDVNTLHYDNSPTAARCYDFGLALGEAIADWSDDVRVAVLTTGGLTHFVIDAEWDRRFLDALRDDDRAALSRLPESELKAGTSECKSWIATAGAMAAAGLRMTEVDYQTLYRTEAGTGSACGFTLWA